MMKVLIVEDEADIARLVSEHLEAAGYSVQKARDADQAMRLFDGQDYDLVLLDLMFPGGDGLSMCREMRQKRAGVAIVMLTCKADEIDKVLGLEIGADDYITKPFSLRELSARIRAVLRRRQHTGKNGGTADGTISIGDIFIDEAMRRVVKGGKDIALTAREFDLLSFLAASPGRFYSTDDLLLHVWGYDFEGYARTVISHVNRLRAKIETDLERPVYIKTMRGAGYRFATSEELSGPGPCPGGARKSDELC